jgi:hypothetical protein
MVRLREADEERTAEPKEENGLDPVNPLLIDGDCPSFGCELIVSERIMLEKDIGKEGLSALGEWR